MIKSGFRLGKIVVLERLSFRGKSGDILYKCKCDCGKEVNIKATYLNPNNKVYSKSCGCQAAITNSIREKTHGLSRGKNNSIYIIWQGIKNRCLNTKSFAYKDYGGRGIKICDRWLNFENFYNDMKEGYSKGLTIERKEVNGNYEKSNCCWITRSEQANNRRTTIYINDDFYGTLTIKDAAKIVGIGWQAMYVRIKSWPKERWFENPR